MTDNAVGFQSDASLSYSQAISPTLDSYKGLSGSELIGLANAQSSYSPQVPAGDLAQANQYVQAAASATDPNLKQQLLQQAIDTLSRGGAPSSSAASPQAGGGGAVAHGHHHHHAAGGAEGASGGDSTSTGLTENGNSVNTGEYTISAGTNDDGSLTITNNQTGQSTEVWGDPHVKVNGQDVADFQKGPLNIQLQDGTTVHIDPTATNSSGVAHIGQVSITKGDQSVTMGGTGANGFSNGVNTSAVTTGDAGFQSSLYNAPNATDITLGADGNLYYNNANGSMGSEITAQQGGGETDLDGAGGGLVGSPSSGYAGGATGKGGTDMQSEMTQLEGLLAQNQESFYGIMMQQTLKQMMSQSGYANAG